MQLKAALDEATDGIKEGKVTVYVDPSLCAQKTCITINLTIMNNLLLDLSCLKRGRSISFGKGDENYSVLVIQWLYFLWFLLPPMPHPFGSFSFYSYKNLFSSVCLVHVINLAAIRLTAKTFILSLSALKP